MHRPFRIVRLFMHFSANSPQWRLRGPILYTIPWSPIRLPRRDQGIVYKLGPRNRHWDAFAEICINNRTTRHDTKGAVPIVYCFRKTQLWGSKSHAVYFIPLCFISDGALILGRCQKFVSGIIIMGIWQVRRLLRWDLEQFQWSYIILTPFLWPVRQKPCVLLIKRPF